MTELRPMDIVVLNGEWFMPHHWIIEAKTMSEKVHAALVKNADGDIWNPIFTGVKDHNLTEKYRGRNLAVKRYIPGLSAQEIREMIDYADWRQRSILGYDFESLAGEITGIRALKSANRDRCDEFPFLVYWENGHRIADHKLDWPEPKFFYQSPLFETVFEGRWQQD